MTSTDTIDDVRISPAVKVALGLALIVMLLIVVIAALPRTASDPRFIGEWTYEEWWHDPATTASISINNDGVAHVVSGNGGIGSVRWWVRDNKFIIEDVIDRSGESFREKVSRYATATKELISGTSSLTTGPYEYEIIEIDDTHCVIEKIPRPPPPNRPHRLILKRLLD